MNLDTRLKHYYTLKIASLPLPPSPLLARGAYNDRKEWLHDTLGILTLTALWLFMIHPQSFGMVTAILPGISVFLPAAM